MKLERVPRARNMAERLEEAVKHAETIHGNPDLAMGRALREMARETGSASEAWALKEMARILEGRGPTGHPSKEA